MYGVDVNLDIMVIGGLDVLQRLLQCAGDLDDGFRVKPLDPFHHVWRDIGQNALDSVGLVAEENEVEVPGDVALGVNPGAEGDSGADTHLAGFGDGVKLVRIAVVASLAVPRAGGLILSLAGLFVFSPPTFLDLAQLLLTAFVLQATFLSLQLTAPGGASPRAGARTSMIARLAGLAALTDLAESWGLLVADGGLGDGGSGVGYWSCLVAGLQRRCDHLSDA